MKVIYGGYNSLSRLPLFIIAFSISILLLVCISCESDSPTESNTTSLTKLSGDGQTGAPGDTLSTPLVVLVTDNKGKAVSGQWLDFSIIEGDAVLSDTLVVTDNIGKAETKLILGDSGGEIKVKAKLYNTDIETIFTAFSLTYTISGTVTGTNDVTVTISGDAAENQVVNDNEKYSFNIGHGRNYTVTPSKTGYTFTPESKSFSNVKANQSQDFTASIIQYTLTMAVNQAGLGTTTPAVGEHTYDYGSVVEIKALPADYYSFVSWSGDVDLTTPSTTVTMSDNKTVTAIFEVVTFIISGTVTGADGVTVTLIGDDFNIKTTDAQGNYSFTVPEGGNYTVTPSKSGYTFTPSSQSFSNMTNNETQNFQGIQILDSKIAFQSDRDRNWEIYVMDVDGSIQNITNNKSSWERDPSWSPDGSKIAFTSNRDGNVEIYISNHTRITNNSAYDYDPSWSPDGLKIAFSSDRDGNVEIYLMDADGSIQTNLTNNSADDYDPSWSPDGSRIAFTSLRDGNAEIYLMDADGSNQTNLTNNSAYDYNPSWSPDGSRIAFDSYRDGNDEIYLMNTDGSNQTRITNNSSIDSAPSWSPDGSQIAFESYRDGNREIYVMDADGSNQTRLTYNSADDCRPSWSPF